MQFDIAYSQEKNELLKKTRGICFEDVSEALGKGGYIDSIAHRNREKYPNQKILVVKIKNYIYAVPYIFNSEKNLAFLKTVYPDRKLTKRYLRKKV